MSLYILLFAADYLDYYAREVVDTKNENNFGS